MYLAKKDNDDPDKGKAPHRGARMRGVQDRKKINKQSFMQFGCNVAKQQPAFSSNQILFKAVMKKKQN